MAYVPVVFTDEVPQSTPVKYRIKDSLGNVIEDNITIEVVTQVTAGTPLNATNLNHMEAGIGAAQNAADAAQAAADAAQLDANKAVYLYGLRAVPAWCLVNGSSPLTTDDKFYFPVDSKFNGGSVFTVYARCIDPSTSGDVTLDVKKNGVSILTTPITIEQGEVSSKTAAVQPVIGLNNGILTDDLIEVVVTAAGVGATFCGVMIVLLPDEM